MKNENEKKGLFVRLTENKKAKKSSCCCNFEVEEIPDEKVDNKIENNNVPMSLLGEQPKTAKVTLKKSGGCGCSGGKCC